jgi:hypothetical protein
VIDDRPLGAHPDAEKLSAYHADELSPEEDDAIQEHVAGCRLCAERLLELERYLEPAERKDEGVEDFATAAEWRRLRGRMAQRGIENDREGLLRSLRVFQVLAAALGVLVVGLTIFAFLQGRPGRLWMLPSKTI